MAQPFRHPESGIYQLRRKVPAALRDALGHEFKRSLKTRDVSEAKARFAAAWQESEQAFALARAQAKGEATYGVTDAHQIAARWFRAEQARMEGAGSFTNMLAADQVVTDQHGDEYTMYDTLQAAASPDNLDWREVVERCMQHALRKQALPTPAKGSAAHGLLYAAFDEYVHKLSAWALERHEGKPAPLGVGVAPLAPIKAELHAAQAKASKRYTLRELFAAYAQDKTLTDGDTRSTRRTIAAYGAIIQGFIELQGDLAARDVTRSAIAEYRAALARLPAKGVGIRALTAPQLIEKADRDGLPRLAEPTIRNRLRAVSAVLSYGVRVGWLDENPVIASGAGKAAAKAARRKQVGSGRRNHYSAEELRAIFSSPLYSAEGWTPPKADFGSAWYWLPLLLYYTGARREELAQLAVADVLHDDAAGSHLSILATGDEDESVRGVKTMGSRRLIPLHPDLIERGFMDYVRSVPTDGQLFPKLRPDPMGYFGANFGKRWAAYVRGVVKLKSPARPSHGFRHSFKTLCREVGIPEDVHDAITGHAGDGGVARGYGEMPLLRMAEEIKRLPRAGSHR
jgi:integrase